MDSLRIPGRVALLVGAIVLVPQQWSAVRADGANGRGRVEITFTKWVLNGGLGPFMEGRTGGDVEGTFLGEVFANVPSQRVPPLVNRLEVIYAVQADDESHSFTSVIRGGQGKPTGVGLGSRAFLDGRIVLGWRKGAQVHVEWVAMTGPADCPSPPAGAGALCFVGTITIERAEHHDGDDDN